MLSLAFQEDCPTAAEHSLNPGPVSLLCHQPTLIGTIIADQVCDFTTRIIKISETVNVRSGPRTPTGRSLA